MKHELESFSRIVGQADKVSISFDLREQIVQDVANGHGDRSIARDLGMSCIEAIKHTKQLSILRPPDNSIGVADIKEPYTVLFCQLHNRSICISGL